MDRWKRTAYRRELREYKADIMAENAEKLISGFANKKVSIKSFNEMVNCYYSYDEAGENMLIHIINASDTLNSKMKDGGHADVVPVFLEDAPKNFTADLKVDISGAKEAYLISVEIEKEVVLDIAADGNSINIHIPEGLFSGYGLVRIPLNQQEGEQ